MTLNDQAHDFLIKLSFFFSLLLCCLFVFYLPQRCGKIAKKFQFPWTGVWFSREINSASPVSPGAWQSPPCVAPSLAFEAPQTYWLFSGPRSVREDGASKACPILSFPAGGKPSLVVASHSVQCVLGANGGEMQTASSKRPRTLSSCEHAILTSLHSKEKEEP